MSDLNEIYEKLGSVGSDVKTLFKKIDEMDRKADDHREKVDGRLTALEDVHKGAKVLSKAAMFLLPLGGGGVALALKQAMTSFFGSGGQPS